VLARCQHALHRRAGSLVSLRAHSPELLPGEEASWRCVAQHQAPDGVWVAAGDLYVTQQRLLWQPPRWARRKRRATLSYPLSECTWFGRGDMRPMGHSWGAQVWKRMRLELATGEAVVFTVRRPRKAVEIISRAIALAHSDRGVAPTDPSANPVASVGGR
jgi:hypothetical protein